MQRTYYTLIALIMIGWALPTHADTMKDAKALLTTATEKITNAETVRIVTSEDITSVDDGDTYRTITNSSFQTINKGSVVWGDVTDTEYSNIEGVQETFTLETRLYGSRDGALARIVSVHSTSDYGMLIEKMFSKVKNKWIEVFSKKDVRDFEKISSLFAQSALQDTEVSTFTEAVDMSHTCGTACTKKYSLKGQALTDDIIAYLEKQAVTIADREQDLLQADDLETFTQLKDMGVTSIPLRIEVSQKGVDYFVSTYVTISLTNVEEIDSIVVNTSEHFSTISTKVKAQKKPKRQLTFDQFLSRMELSLENVFYGVSTK